MPLRVSPARSLVAVAVVVVAFAAVVVRAQWDLLPSDACIASNGTHYWDLHGVARTSPLLPFVSQDLARPPLLRRLTALFSLCSQLHVIVGNVSDESFGWSFGVHRSQLVVNSARGVDPFEPAFRDQLVDGDAGHPCNSTKYGARRTTRVDVFCDACPTQTAGCDLTHTSACVCSFDYAAAEEPCAAVLSVAVACPLPVAYPYTPRPAKTLSGWLIFLIVALALFASVMLVCVGTYWYNTRVRGLRGDDAVLGRSWLRTLREKVGERPAYRSVASDDDEAARLVGGHGGGHGGGASNNARVAGDQAGTDVDFRPPRGTGATYGTSTKV